MAPTIGHISCVTRQTNVATIVIQSQLAIFGVDRWRHVYRCGLDGITFVFSFYRMSEMSHLLHREYKNVINYEADVIHMHLSYHKYYSEI